MNLNLFPEYTRAEIDIPSASAEDILDQLTLGDEGASALLDELIESLIIPPYLVTEPSRIAKWPKNPTLRCRISESSWRTDSVVKKLDGQLIIPDPSCHFDIYFEVEVEMRESKMKISLLYRPSAGGRYVKLPSLHPTDLQLYRAGQERFFEIFRHSCHVDGFLLVSGKKTMAAADFNFRYKTVDEVRARLEYYLSEVSAVVDSVLFKLYGARSHSAQAETVAVPLVPSMLSVTSPDQIEDGPFREDHLESPLAGFATDLMTE